MDAKLENTSGNYEMAIVPPQWMPRSVKSFHGCLDHDSHHSPGGTQFVLNQGADLLPCLLARSLTLPLNPPRSVLSAMHFTLKGPAGMREALRIIFGASILKVSFSLIKNPGTSNPY